MNKHYYCFFKKMHALLLFCFASYIFKTIVKFIYLKGLHTSFFNEI